MLCKLVQLHSDLCLSSSPAVVQQSMKSKVDLGTLTGGGAAKSNAHAVHEVVY